MPTWPATLPQSPQWEGFAENSSDTAIRTKMSVGPKKSRRRYTAAIKKFVCPYLLTGAQVDTLNTFIDTDLKGGTLSFDFPHPRTGVTITARLDEAPSDAQWFGYDSVRVTLMISKVNT